MNKTILVTGGAGYIGSHVVKLLGKAGYNVIVYDNLSTGSKESVLFGELIIGDLEDKSQLIDVFKNNSIDAVMHFAGSIVVPESFKNPVKYYENNTINSLKLISLACKYGVDAFIFSSTAAVYGHGHVNGADENAIINPINPYGRSKLMTEWCLQDIARAYQDFNYVALRYFNVAGADLDGQIGQSSPAATHLIKVAVQTALGYRDSMQIFGNDYDTPDGTCIRDYIHVMDLAQAHLDSLTYLFDERRSQIMNCGYGHGFSVQDVINVVKKVSGIDFKTEVVGRRAGDSDRLISIPNKIKKLTGWTPRYDNLELIVKTALEWERKLEKDLNEK